MVMPSGNCGIVLKADMKTRGVWSRVLPRLGATVSGSVRRHDERRCQNKLIGGLRCGRSKLNIIEQEFKYAEKTEFWRLKEEEEMRRTIQVKREQALLDAKRIERARRIKEENRIRKGIISAVKNQPSADGAHQMLDMYAALPDPVAFPADSCF